MSGSTALQGTLTQPQPPLAPAQSLARHSCALDSSQGTEKRSRREMAWGSLLKEGNSGVLWCPTSEDAIVCCSWLAVGPKVFFSPPSVGFQCERGVCVFVCVYLFVYVCGDTELRGPSVCMATCTCIQSCRYTESWKGGGCECMCVFVHIS